MAFRGRMGNILLKVQYQFESIFGRLGLSSRIRMEAPTSTFLNQGFRQVQVLETMLMERCSNCLCLSKVPLCEFPRHSLDSRDFTCLAMDRTSGTFFNVPS